MDPAEPLPRRELADEVVRQAQAGDASAREVVLRRYAGPLHALVRRTCPSSDADDLTQSLLQRLLVALPQFQPAGSATLTTWVFAVANHFIIDEHRRRRLSMVPLEEARGVADQAEDPHVATWRGQVRHALEAALAQLPVELRRTFVLAQIYEQPLEAVARAEGVALGTVKSRLFRARALLAAQLKGLRNGGSDAER